MYIKRKINNMKTVTTAFSATHSWFENECFSPLVEIEENDYCNPGDIEFVEFCEVYEISDQVRDIFIEYDRATMENFSTMKKAVHKDLSDCWLLIQSLKLRIEKLER